MFKRQSIQALGPNMRPCCAPLGRLSTIRTYVDIQTPPPPPTPKHNDQQQQQQQQQQQSTGPRTRHQRAAQASQEIRMLSRDAPAPPSGASPSPYPSTQPRGGIDAEPNPSAQMGADPSSSSREGPLAQQPGRPYRATAGSDRKTLPEALSERSPSSAPDTRARVLVADGRSTSTTSTSTSTSTSSSRRDQEKPEFTSDADLAEDDGPEAPSTAHELQLLAQWDRQDISAVPFAAGPVTAATFLELGEGGATIAGNNFAGVLEDRLKLLAERTQDGLRYAPDMAARMMRGGLVSFESEEERGEVLEAARKYAAQRAERRAGQKGDAVTEDLARQEHGFAPLGQKTRDGLVDKLVRGRYELDAAAGNGAAGNGVLAAVLKNTRRNGTYLESDSNKLLAKIRTLLPADLANGARKGAPKAAAAAAKK